jgi:hypothetical protein
VRHRVTCVFAAAAATLAMTVHASALAHASASASAPTTSRTTSTPHACPPISSTTATDCLGGHNGLCWDHDLNDLIPRLRQAFTTAG